MIHPIHNVRSVGLFGCLFFCATAVAEAQNYPPALGPDFVNDYALDPLYNVPGVPTPYGGMEFKAGDPNKLLIIGMAEDPLAAIYEVDVTRDADGHVDGFSGSATLFANTPNADAGLRYGPGGVLFYTTYNTNTLGQLLPGSSAPDKVVSLTPLGVAPSTGGLSITPGGFPEAGSLKLTSYNADAWYDADLVPDGMGTYDVANVAFRTSIVGAGPESILYVDTSYPAFANQSVVVCEWFTETVSVYEIDANGDPLVGTRRALLACCGYWPLGSALDPSTGDFVFGDYGSGDQLVLVHTMAGPLGTNYCSPAIPNSTGLPGIVSAYGLPTVPANDVTLTAEQLPPGQFGYFLCGMTQGFFNPPGSSGFICLSGQIGRYNRASEIIQGPAGSLALDLMAMPFSPPQPALSGETWYFQCWYRETGGSNFTDGVEIAFQ